MCNFFSFNVTKDGNICYCNVEQRKLAVKNDENPDSHSYISELYFPGQPEMDDQVWKYELEYSADDRAQLEARSLANIQGRLKYDGGLAETEMKSSILSSMMRWIDELIQSGELFSIASFHFREEWKTEKDQEQIRQFLERIVGIDGVKQGVAVQGDKIVIEQIAQEAVRLYQDEYDCRKLQKFPFQELNSNSTFVIYLYKRNKRIINVFTQEENEYKEIRFTIHPLLTESVPVSWI